MTSSLLSFPAAFSDDRKKRHIKIFTVSAGRLAAWLEDRPERVKTQVREAGFDARRGQVLLVKDESGALDIVLAGVNDPCGHYDIGYTVETLAADLSAEALAACSFEIEDSGLTTADMTRLHIGWGWACYSFAAYKKDSRKKPALTWSRDVDRKRVLAFVESVCLLRNLINTPSNDLGTDELADAAQLVARKHGAKFSKIVDGDLLKQNFPMIYAVGHSSPRRPQLLDLRWGKPKDPKVTLVGKGVVFDTGGLNLKPGKFMALMKKDMGGSAHVLALAWLIMSLDLPVNLRVLIPVAENAVAGESFRPGDVLQSRKGLTVEVSDTDAEGRLVVADALAYGAEDKPDLLVDFCTLTGSARAALGYDIPAIFSNRDLLLDKLLGSSTESEDPLWPLPLWQPYLREMDSKIADINNIGSGTAGAIHGGLFLQKFVDEAIDWIHIDCYAWEQFGKPGRPQGGADTGMRAVFDLIEKRYAA